MKHKCLHCKNKSLGCTKFCTSAKPFDNIIDYNKKLINIAKAEKAMYQNLKEGLNNGK